MLVTDTVRVHRWGALAWVLGAAVAMYVIALGFVTEVARFAGGAKAMAASLLVGAQALRLLRWPAERLDTLGGYLTYHNVTMFVFAISLYAAVQGTHAVRGPQTAGQLEEVLATGRSRGAVIVDRAVGFALTLMLICAGLGLALIAAMAAGGQPDPGGSLITALACGLCALAAYSSGVLISQLAGSVRSGTALTAAGLTVLYLLTNVADELGPAGAVRFASPFHYFNASRALVPGHGLDLPATAALLCMTATMLAAAAWAFQRRDYAAGLWARQRRTRPRNVRVQRPALHAYWSAVLLRERLGLIAWAAGGASA